MATDLDDTVALTAVPVALPLRDVYREVFPAQST